MKFGCVVDEKIPNFSAACDVRKTRGVKTTLRCRCEKNLPQPESQLTPAQARRINEDRFERQEMSVKIELKNEFLDPVLKIAARDDLHSRNFFCCVVASSRLSE